MKLLTALSLLTLSLSSFASTEHNIEVKYPSSHQGYYGTIAEVEKELKADLMKEAVKACGTLANVAAIADVEAKFSFDVIVLDEAKFEGSYPLASATAEATCRQ